MIRFVYKKTSTFPYFMQAFNRLLIQIKYCSEYVLLASARLCVQVQRELCYWGYWIEKEVTICVHTYRKGVYYAKSEQAWARGSKGLRTGRNLRTTFTFDTLFNYSFILPITCLFIFQQNVTLRCNLVFSSSLDGRYIISHFMRWEEFYIFITIFLLTFLALCSQVSS